jgi:hypothetical protein
MEKDVKVGLYFSIDDGKNITIDKFIKMLDEIKHRNIFLGIFTARYGKQKIEVFEGLTKVIGRIVGWVPQITEKAFFSSNSFSEICTGSYLCICSSLLEKTVKLAYIYGSIVAEERTSVSGTEEMKEWFPKFMNDKNRVLYTKKKVLSDKRLKESFSGCFESEIILPFDVFFGSFFDQVGHYWRILKEAGLIKDDWEELEKAITVVEKIRETLNMV